MSGTTVTYVDPQVMLEALYEALKAYKRGEFQRGCMAVGILDPEISAVYLAVEKVAG